MPPVYLHLGPYNVSELFWPAIALPTITFGLLYLWPFIEQRVTHDRSEHHVLDRPSQRPVRTALGVVVLTFYSVLLLAGAQDIWSQQLDVSLSAVLWTFRVLVFVLPVLFGAFTYKVCRDLERHRHAARVAESADAPVAQNEEPEAPPAREPERADAPRAP
jgi:ubiquinol-cytochrome c reductase cytochrome b subunit